MRGREVATRCPHKAKIAGANPAPATNLFMKEILIALEQDDKPDCPYCGSTAELKKSRDVYPHARQDYGVFWVCPGDCDAYVGTHSNSTQHAPLGRLANKELREWKKKAHAAFDPMWQKSHADYLGFSRHDAYDWLTQQMGRVKQAHIGECDVSECRQIVEICNDIRYECRQFRQPQTGSAYEQR